MSHRSSGKRTFKGHEASLIRALIAFLRDILEQELELLIETPNMELECDFNADCSLPDDDLTTSRRLVLAAVRESDGSIRQDTC